MKYAFIKQQSLYYPVTLLCKVMGVKKSSYYDWKGKGAQVIPVEEFQLRQRMKVLFVASRESLGSRMMVKQLRAQGFVIGRYRVRKLMKKLNLIVKAKRKYKVTTDSDHTLPVAENVLDRQFNPTQANQVWASDITYVWTQEGWLYLAAILDLYTRRIVGWAMSKRMTGDLTRTALRMAIGQRRPTAGLIHHSDQGSQYTDHAYQALLKAEGVQISMNGVGTWYDYAPMESFFGTLKNERVHHRVYRTRDEARSDLFYYIEAFYNRRRRHSSLDYLCPEAYEQLYYQQQRTFA